MNDQEETLYGLATRIKHLRAERQLSQKDVAAFVGVSQAKWSRVEQTGELSVSELIRLQALFELETLESFFGELPSQRVGRADDVPSPGVSS